jgi:peptidylprolyl isomerase
LLPVRPLLWALGSGKNSNSSQFFVTLDKAPQCDGKHVIVGRVVNGLDVVRQIAACASPDGTPTCKVWVADCGVL